MGLDMYLICNDKDVVRALNIKGKVGNNEIIDLKSPDFEEAGLGDRTKFGTVVYWRKANMIHNWFVNNVLHGEDNPLFSKEVSLNQLVTLADLCKTVIDSSTLIEQGTREEYSIEDGNLIKVEVPNLVIEDPTVPKNTLPYCDGFFFGDSETYGEWYLHDVEFTYNRIADILALFSPAENGKYSHIPTYKDNDWIVSFTYQTSW